MTVNEAFILEPVDTKASRFAVVVVYHDARVIPRVEKLMGRHGKIKSRTYHSVEDRYDNPVDRIGIYVLEDVVSDRAIKSILKNIETSGDIQSVMLKC
ncbi:MAG: hypothetical protein ABIJ47_03985 [Candidatus Bathyarchaeota archaeon]